MRRRRALVFSSAVLYLLASCSIVPNDVSLPAQSDGFWKGRFSLTVQGPDGQDSEEQTNEDRAQGKFELRQLSDQMDLSIFSPFGQTMAKAHANATGATLTTSEGKTVSAANANELILNALGWRIPVESFPGWLSGSGLPADDTRVASDGWSVRVEQRLSNGKPRVLSANWPIDAKSNQTSLKLIVIVAGR